MNNNTKKYIELFNELSTDETISINNRVAFKQLYGFCIIDADSLLNLTPEELKLLYDTYEFGQIFVSDKKNNRSRNTFRHFVEIIFELKDFITIIKKTDKKNEDIKRILKESIFTISENNDKPYKTGIIDFIKTCKLKFIFGELYSQSLSYFMNYDKDLITNFMAYDAIFGLKTTNILYEKKDVNLLFNTYKDNQELVVDLLNNIFAINNIGYNEEIYKFLYNRFFLSSMLLDNYIHICNILFKKNSINIYTFINTNIINKQFSDVTATECDFQNTKFVPCEGTNIGYYICDSAFSNEVKEICKFSKKVKVGGYKIIRQKTKTIKNIRKPRNIRKTKNKS
jgi:hypothetical protein